MNDKKKSWKASDFPTLYGSLYSYMYPLVSWRDNIIQPVDPLEISVAEICRNGKTEHIPS